MMSTIPTKHAQMRYSLRASLTSAAAALSLFALNGCGGGNNDKPFVVVPTPTPSSPVTPSPSPTPTPTPNAPARRIVFVSGGIPSGIFSMNPDGSNRTRLTTNASDGKTHDVEPALSPDGTQIAFLRSTLFGGSLMVMSVDGTNQRQLANRSFYIQDPRWHPDGTHLVYAAADTRDDTGVFTIRTDGTGEKRLTQAGDAFMPDWSPDGRKLAFVSQRSGTMDIYTINADGSELARATDTSDYDEWFPRWSPDGKKLVGYTDFRELRNGLIYTNNAGLYVINADGSGRTTVGPENSLGPSWSPDGMRILFYRGKQVSDLFTMNPDGSDIRNLTNSSEAETNPSW